MNRARNLIIGLFLVSALALPRPLGATTGDAPLCDLTTALGNLKSQVERNGFNTHRGLKDYFNAFGAEFAEDLLRLGPEGHWVDAGAGDALATYHLQTLPDESINHWFSIDRMEIYQRDKWGRFQKDYVKTGYAQRLEAIPRDQRPRITAITFKPKKEFPTFPDPGRAKLLSGRYFSEIPPSEIEPADILTDFFGIAAYSPDLDQVLRRYDSLLKRDGTAYIVLGYGYPGGNPPHVLQTGKLFVQDVLTRSGQHLNLPDWLKSIPGWNVDIRIGVDYDPVVVAKIQKTSAEPVKIPELELLSQEKWGAPPIRTYREK
ncbi:MAG: hypothetical protein ACXWPM_01465 [Bdellovibrionota bacterium]